MTASGSILPQNWISVPIVEAIDKPSLTGIKLKQSDYKEEGVLPVIDQGQKFIGGFTDRKELKVLCKLPVIIFGDHTKVLKYVDFDFVAGADGVKVLKPLGLFYPKLFYYFLQAVELPDKGYARHFQFLEKSVIPVPPLPEQHRIVARIEELFSRLDAGVEALGRAKAQLQRYRQSVLQAAVTGRLTAEWRTSHPEVEPAEELLEDFSKSKVLRPEKLSKEDKNGLPEGWVWATINQLTSKVTSGSRGWARYYSDSGAIFIRAQDIKTDKILLDQIAFVKIPSNSEGTRTRVQLRDILIVITGANVTKSALIENDLGEAYVSQHVGLIRPSIADVAPYLYTCLIAPYGRGILKNQAYGAGKPGLNLDNIRNLIVRLPPLFEQKIIAEEVTKRMSIADKIEEEVHNNIKRSNRFRQSILKHAFEGKLVPQDPSEEPASLLLERIRAERKNESPRRGRESKAHQARLSQ